ncbi:MAG TPA: hypothetical protein VGK20_04590 [Candidatus Binatia bacterium]
MYFFLIALLVVLVLQSISPLGWASIFVFGLSFRCIAPIGGDGAAIWASVFVVLVFRVLIGWQRERNHRRVFPGPDNVTTA